MYYPLPNQLISDTAETQTLSVIFDYQLITTRHYSLYYYLLSTLFFKKKVFFCVYQEVIQTSENLLWLF